ncbi:MAG: caspase family protein [Cyclobacteriaceae bacterium]
MKQLIALSLCLVAFSIASAQEAVYRTSPVEVDFESVDNPTLIAIVSPANLEEKTRGFTPVKGRQLQLSGKITDADGIDEVMINSFPVFVTGDGSFSTMFSLQKGNNDILVEVTDSKGNQTEKLYQVRSEDEETTTPLAGGDELSGQGKYYALLIGIEEYDDPAITDLDNPVRDAEKLARILVENYTFEQENVTVIKNATRADIVDALDVMSRNITPNDNLLLFYAGHGYYQEETEVGYWIPSDGRSFEVSTANWFRNSTLTEQIGTINSKHTLLIADACFSGSIFKTRKAFMDASLAVNKMYEVPSRKAMTSGTLTEVPDRSEFLIYLTRRLESNTEKYLRSEHLFMSMQDAVINNTDIIPQFGTIQKVGDEGGDFIFIRKDR